LHQLIRGRCAAKKSEIGKTVELGILHGATPR
jgi:hypothetical protein